MPDLPPWQSSASLTNLITIAANPVLANKLLAGDANPAFQINGDGSLHWGPGGAGALDTSITRVAVGVLGFPGGAIDTPMSSFAIKVNGTRQLYFDGGVPGTMYLDATLRNNNAGNEAAAATAGANGAPPAQVMGYLIAKNQAGATIKIPYYAA